MQRWNIYTAYRARVVEKIDAVKASDANANSHLI